LPYILAVVADEPDQLGQADDRAPLLREGSRRPHHTNVRIDQMGVFFVVDASGVSEDLGLEPLTNFWCRHQLNSEIGLLS
jgi:hypothetical protein